ncbi:DUF421 domain-containing protein [Terriglobus albidus]|uniref:DUF421 domain-containing protein n=1 Tax=Terriglobus albidus TaxID=1592106 RepID=UPI0021E07823|nr:YetF domain-containing protein [Terriglobus albidus]
MMATILRAILAYWALIIVVRAIGRRPGGQITPFEFVLIFFIGGISIQAVVVDDRSITNAFTAVATVALMHVLVTALKQWFPAFGRVIDGTPVLIFENGEWHRERMKHHGVQETDVMSAARAQGLEREDQIKYAVLERKGDISIIKAS